MSDWKESAIKRRDARATKSEPKKKPKGKKKDTKTWCRGKVGVEHQPVCYTYEEYKGEKKFPKWRYLVCQVCNKELKFYLPHGLNEPPEWVDH